MKLFSVFILSLFIIVLNGQSIDIDSINFYDELKFDKIIKWKFKEQIDFIEYNEKGGSLKKIDYFDSKYRIKQEQVWSNKLIKDVSYSYAEKGRVRKSYDILNNKKLPVDLNISIRYPALARENQIEGTVEVAINYDGDCIPKTYEILNRLGHGIDEEVEKTMKLIVRLSTKYSVSFRECLQADENFKLVFKLE